MCTDPGGTQFHLVNDLFEIAKDMKKDMIQRSLALYCCYNMAAFGMFGQLSGITLMLIEGGPQRPTQPIKMLLRSELHIQSLGRSVNI